jgi:hypothetical protein
LSGRLSITNVRRALGALAGLAIVLGCAFVVSACGSSSAASGTTTGTIGASGATGATGAASTAGLTAYSNCLKSHGVTFPQGFGFGRGATGARGPNGAGGFFRRGATGARGASGGRGPSGAGGFFRRGGSGPTGARGFAGALTPAQQKAITACASLRPTGGFGFGGGRFNATNPAFAKFQTCLAQHGIKTGSTSDRTSTAFRTALAACRSLLPTGSAGGLFGGAGATGATGSGAAASTSSSFTKFQACLKKHGVKPGAANQSQSATSAALAACRSLLPNNGNGSGATTTTSG